MLDKILKYRNSLRFLRKNFFLYLCFFRTVDEPETAPSAADQETEQGTPPASHQAVGKDEETVPAETDADPTAAAESSDHTSSGAVLISGFETVMYCRNSPVYF